eukprot:TRINITY_DN60364_c0_g2_i1.p1 TRINITY_DN60364_c0_g2~~TRINITY_DN60364_c0_g2_i1.p1  ORF type:complete len:456 (+),score=96.26 TRINITY_DN60364_c0_g2_i1:99-1466(+)
MTRGGSFVSAQGAFPISNCSHVAYPPMVATAGGVMSPRLTSSTSVRQVSMASTMPLTYKVRHSVSPPPATKVTTETPPLTLYKHTLQGSLARLQHDIAELERIIFEERRCRNHRRHSIDDEREARQATDKKVQAIAKQLKAARAGFSLEGDAWLHGGQPDLRKSLHEIEARRNISVDLHNGRVILLRPITFKPRLAGDGPVAEFADADAAEEVVKDIALVAKLFNCAMTIEGHTKGGNGRFWQTLAENRAKLVAERVTAHGVNKGNVTQLGRPGHLGSNDSRVDVILALPSLADRPVDTSNLIRRDSSPSISRHLSMASGSTLSTSAAFAHVRAASPTPTPSRQPSLSPSLRQPSVPSPRQPSVPPSRQPSTAGPHSPPAPGTAPGTPLTAGTPVGTMASTMTVRWTDQVKQPSRYVQPLQPVQLVSAPVLEPVATRAPGPVMEPVANRANGKTC